MRVSIKLVIFSSILLLFFVAPSKLLAATEVFSDDFESGSGKWEVVGDSGWQVVNGEYGVHVQPGRSASFPIDDFWNYGWKNIEYEVDVRGVQGIDKNIMVKYHDDENFVSLHQSGETLYFEQRINDVGSVITSTSDYKLENGQKHSLLFIVNGNNTKVFLDEVGLILEGNDSLPIETDWKSGFRVGSGGFGVAEVWFDNVRVSLLPDEPVGVFELPFDYDGRGEGDVEMFKAAFWDRVSSFFDHEKDKGVYVPYTGVEYTAKCLLNKSSPNECYNGHNGVDFSRIGGKDVYAVAEGRVAYASETASPEPINTCLNKGGYGCVVVIDHGEGLHSLYAHLKEISVEEGDLVNEASKAGEMGATGKAKGVHLHFGALRQILPLGLDSFVKMNKSDWEELISHAEKSEKTEVVIDGGTSACTYTLQNGLMFNMVDPSGWAGDGVDPWSESLEDGGCGVDNEYLWKYPID